MGYIGKKYGANVIKILSFVKVTLPLFEDTLNFCICAQLKRPANACVNSCPNT